MRYISPVIYDFATLRKYRDDYYKLTNIKRFRQFHPEDIREYSPKGKINKEKLCNNLSRAKGKVFEYSYCNDWELFVTLTLDKRKYDRKDIKKFIKDFAQFVRNYKRKYNVPIKYLLIPEQHKDGAWHMHGFLMGLPQEYLKAFNVDDRLPVKILNRLKEGKEVFTWKEYSEKFGFCDIEKIENHKAASKYMTKYITKETQHTIKELGAHSYYCSQGLEKSKVIHRDILAKEIIFPTYENDYMQSAEFDNAESGMKHFYFD